MRLFCIAKDCGDWFQGTPEQASIRGWWQKAGMQGLCPKHEAVPGVPIDPTKTNAKLARLKLVAPRATRRKNP